jgi:hypothetical protein
MATSCFRPSASSGLFPSTPAFRASQQKQKSRCCEVRVSGPEFRISAVRFLSAVLRRHAHRIVMMMVKMAAGNHNDLMLLILPTPEGGGF